MKIFNKIKDASLEFRQIPNNTDQIFDTLIFKCSNKSKEKIIKLLNKKGLEQKTYLMQ